MNIYQRLNKVREKVKYLKRDAEVQGYMAITHDAVTAAVRPHLTELGIFVVPNVVSSHTVATGATYGKNSTPVFRYEGRFEVWFINAENPDDKVSMMVDAHGVDTGDKAPDKARSLAKKGALLKMFDIETGIDEESRQVYDGEKVIELKKLIDEGDAIGLFNLRYSETVESWVAIWSAVKEGATKKREFEKQVESLLKEAEETMAHYIVQIREAVGREDGAFVVQLWDELTVPQKRYVWANMKPHEHSYIRQQNEPRKAA